MAGRAVVQRETVCMQCLIGECSNMMDEIHGWQLYGDTCAIVYLIYPIEVTVMVTPFIAANIGGV